MYRLTCLENQVSGRFSLFSTFLEKPTAPIEPNGKMGNLSQSEKKIMVSIDSRAFCLDWEPKNEPNVVSEVKKPTAGRFWAVGGQ